MKHFLLTIILAFTSVVVVTAQSYLGTSSYSTSTSVRYQSGYTRSDGAYVQGHYKTCSNGTNHDNYSTKGNVNAFTGSAGTRARDYSSSANNYGVGKTIYTGSRGGQYYINSNGNKTYVPQRRY